MLSTAAVAGAARLIAVGEPVPPVTGLPERFAPPGDAPNDLVLTAADERGALPFAARIYDGPDDSDCIIVGRVRGRTLGVVGDGEFRPYEEGRQGVCGRLAGSPLFFSAQFFAGGGPPRTVVFGRADESVDQLRVTGVGTPRVLTPGRGGAFVLVYDGRVDERRLSIRSVD